MTDKIFYVEHKLGSTDDDWVEFEYKVEVDDFEPYDAGICSGPPERCRPPEGGYVEVCEDTIWRRRTDIEDAKWEEVAYSVFLEGHAESFSDDPEDKKYRKTAMEKAYDDIQEEIYQACLEQMEADREDAEIARYEARMEALEDW